MKRNAATVLLAAIVLIAGGMGRANAGVIQLTDPSQLGAADSTFTDTDPPSTIYPGPSVSFTAVDNTLTWSRGSGEYETDVAGAAGTYFPTAFPDGTQLFFAGGFAGFGSIDGLPITLTFASAVSNFGVNIEDFDPGPYTVVFTVYDGATDLGTFSASGCDPFGICSPVGGVLSFEGAAATGSDVITSVVFDDSAAGGSNNLGFGPVTYGDDAPSAPSSGTPEPSTMVLFGLGVAGIALIRHLRSA